MRISDWSSDVCSSDLGRLALAVVHGARPDATLVVGLGIVEAVVGIVRLGLADGFQHHGAGRDKGKATLLEAGDEAETVGALDHPDDRLRHHPRSEEHTSELQSLMRISYAVFCLKKKNNTKHKNTQ